MSAVKKLDKFFDKNYKKIFGYGLIAAGVLIILYYLFFCLKTEIHADCMDTIMWANASHNAGSLFNENFTYACLLPFGGQLLMQPFIAIFGLSYKAHIIGMVLFMVIFVSALTFMLRSMDISVLKTGGIVFSLLMFTLASEKLREIFWGHIIYYSLGLTFLFVGVGLTFVILKKTDKEDKGIVLPAVLLFIWTLLCATDGIQALTIYILPLCAAVCGYVLFNINENLFIKRNRIIISTAVILLFAMVCGLGLLSVLSKDITQGYASAYSEFNSSDTWFDNLSMLLSAHYTLLGVDVNSDMAIMSFEGVINVLRIIFASFIAVVPFFGAIFYPKLKRSAQIFTLIYFTVTFLVMIGWVFGKISNANWRLVPVETVGFILTVLLVYELCQKGRYMRLGFTGIAPIFIYSMISIYALMGISTDYENENSVFEEINLLEENGCTYGYATFWNANIATVLSDDNIKVRGVSFEDGVIEPYYYQSQKDWYTGETKPDEKYFILLTQSEYLNFRSEEYPVENVISSDNFVLLTLSENISFE